VSVVAEAEEHAESKPRLRGRLHQAALVVAIPASVRLVAAAPTMSTRVATTIYAVSLIGLFGASAAYHLLSWSPSALRRARVLDHCMIFFLIAGSYTAFSVLALDGPLRAVVLAIVWVGALIGIALKLFDIEALPRVGGALYIGLGWAAVLALPQLLIELDLLPLVLVVAGGLMYTAGTLVLLRRRPDPNPLVFGYHEVWHAIVIAASTCHYVAVSMLLSSTG
jgi:hemolysin III